MLVKKKAINMHMGLSPYYRGSSCNFWALFDSNTHLVGSSIHLLSKGLDNGKILYHALPSHKSRNLYEYTMSSVLSAHLSLVKRIKNRSVFNFKPIIQDSNCQIRYTQRKIFNDNILNQFFKKKLDANNIRKNLRKRFDKKMFIRPYLIQVFEYNN